jgi:hypothetical protein
VRRHIAQASNVLSIPVTIVNIPIMRFTFVSVERFGEAVADGSTRLWLDQEVLGDDTRSAYPYLTQMGTRGSGNNDFCQESN